METKLDSELLYDGKIIKVYRDQVRVKNGNTAIREVVRHNGGVGILGVKDGKILLVEQYRYPNQTYTLEIPAGKLEVGEEPIECAIREFEEETGHQAKEMKQVSKFLPTPGYCDEWLYIYEATDIYEVENPLPADEDEFINVIELDIEEAYRKTLDGSICDGKTVIAIMHAYIQYINKKSL